MLNPLRTAVLVFTSLLYVAVSMPIRALLKALEARPDATLLVRPGLGSIMVEPYARGEVAGLVYNWASRAGLRLNAQGRLIRRAYSPDHWGYVLSLAASLKDYLESRGFGVTVRVRRAFGEDLAAVVEVKKQSILLRARKILESVRLHTPFPGFQDRRRVSFTPS